jgi:hypothetical protein
LAEVPVVCTSIAYDFSQKKVYQVVVTGICRDTVFGCEVILRKFKINFSEFVPGSDADMVNLKVYDSGANWQFGWF